MFRLDTAFEGGVLSLKNMSLWVQTFCKGVFYLRKKMFRLDKVFEGGGLLVEKRKTCSDRTQLL